MMTVHEVSKLAGISIRTLQYYDNIGLLHPSGHSDAGYRLYDDSDLQKLQQVLLFRELGFQLKEIQEIMRRPGFDRDKALDEQITLLQMQRERLDQLIQLACEIKETGVQKYMDFKAFDTAKIDEYKERAKAEWGGTDAYREYEEKSTGRTDQEQQELNVQMMNIFREFSAVKTEGTSSPEAQALVKKLQDFISEHYYHCSEEILASLGKAYGSGGEFTKNINAAAGEGAAEFTSKAIEVYCRH